LNNENISRTRDGRSIGTRAIDLAAAAVLADFANIKVRLISEDSLRQAVASAAKRTERLYLTQIAYCVYVLLTVAGIRDVDFFQSAEATLPLISLKVPLGLFLVAAPIIAISIFSYFQMNLSLLHKMMLADERAMLVARSSAWLALFWYGDAGTRRLSFRVWLIRILTNLPIWGLVPVTTFLCWARLAPFHWEAPESFNPGSRLPDLPSATLMGAMSLLAIIAITMTFFYRRFEYLVITGPVDGNASQRLLLRAVSACVVFILLHIAYDRWSTQLFPLQLAEAKLDNFVLIGAELPYANLYKASLNSADLSRANLRGARLDYANLGFANLNEAHLEGSVLASANLIGTKLIGAHLEGAYMRYANLQGASLVNAYLEGANLVDAHLEGASLINTQLQGADLSGAFLIGADMTRENPEKYRCKKPKEFGCQTTPANGAHLRGAILSGAHLEGSILNSVDLQGADLTKANLDSALLSFASFAGSNLDSATFEGATTANSLDFVTSPEPIASWLAKNEERFRSVPRLDTDDLLEAIKTRVMRYSMKSASWDKWLERHKELGFCLHQPGSVESIDKCAAARRDRLLELGRGNGAASDLQVAAIRKAWCFESVRLYWRNWHGLSDAELQQVPCPGLQESLGAY
jgi:uncharacterized protein YjbI with pentapeptide repeats